MRVCEYIHLFTSKVGYCLYLSFWGVRANRIALKTKVFVSNSSWMWELKYLYIYNCKMIPNIISKCIFHQSARFRPVLFLPYLTCILSVSVNLKTNLSSIKMSHAWWFFLPATFKDRTIHQIVMSLLIDLHSKFHYIWHDWIGLWWLLHIMISLCLHKYICLDSRYIPLGFV